VFQDYTLARGAMEHRGQKVDPGAITKTALLTVEGENDDISGIGQTQAAHEICANIPENMRRDYIQPGVGHYGVFSGRRFRAEIYPRMRDFMRAFQSAKARSRSSPAKTSSRSISGTHASRATISAASAASIRFTASVRCRTITASTCAASMISTPRAWPCATRMGAA
jgi:hypothetical protein